MYKRIFIYPFLYPLFLMYSPALVVLMMWDNYRKYKKYDFFTEKVLRKSCKEDLRTLWLEVTFRKSIVD